MGTSSYSVNHLTGVQDFEFSEAGIFDLLLQLDTKKATGPDDIPNIFLRRYAEWISKFLVIIFNKSFCTGVVPSQWKLAKIVPIHKSGSKTDPTNYRPVSLLCACSKIFEHILYHQVSLYLESVNFISKYQHGFQKGLSTITQLVDITHSFALAINNNQQTDVIFFRLFKSV